VRFELLYFFLVFVASLGMAFVFVSPSKKAKKWQMYFLKTAALSLPLTTLSYVVGVWCVQMYRVYPRCDVGIMYKGAASSGTPYLEVWINQSPIFFALSRALMLAIGFSLSCFKNIIYCGNYISLTVVIICLVFCYLKLKRKDGISALTTISFLSVLLAGVLLVTRNFAVGNWNIWLAGPVTFYLVTAWLPEKKWRDFLGGMALGFAFMIKPYLLMVLLFLFFSFWRNGWQNKKFFAFWGVVTVGVVGFFSSLMVPGIGVETYRQFVFEVSPHLYEDLSLYNGLWIENLSLLKYLPIHLGQTIGLMIILVLCLIAFLASKKSDNELPWFFVTLLFSPIIWMEHLMGIFPAFLFLLMGKKREVEQIVNCGVIVTLVFFASVIKIQVIVNVCLLFLWVGEVFPVFSKFETKIYSRIEKVLGYSPAPASVIEVY